MRILKRRKRKRQQKPGLIAFDELRLIVLIPWFSWRLILWIELHFVAKTVLEVAIKIA